MLRNAPTGFLTTGLAEGPKNQQSGDCYLLKVARDHKWDKNLAMRKSHAVLG